METVKEAGIIIAALGGAAGLGVSLYKFLHVLIEGFKHRLVRNHNRDEKLEQIQVTCKELELGVLRLTVNSTDISLEERVDAGARYIELGGNHITKLIYEGLAGKLKKQMEQEERT